MASLPTTIAVLSKAETTATEKVNISKSEKEILCGLVAAEYRDEYCDEALKALAVILYTDYSLSPESFDLSDKNVCIYKENADESINFTRIESAVDGVYKKTLCVDGKAFFVPFSYVSDGKTEKSKDYPYLYSVASAWDFYSQDYSDKAECIGVSMYGVNYLCENGSEFTDALKWYLPDFEVR